MGHVTPTARCPACERFISVEPLPDGGWVWSKHVDGYGAKCVRNRTVVPPDLEPGEGVSDMV